MIKYFFGIIVLTFLCICANGQSDNWINIVKMGGQPDGKKIITEALNKASDQIAAQGGGTIYFPAGEYLTGPIRLKSNTTLYLDAGAILRFSDNFDDYLPYVEMRWEGVVMKSFSPLISAKDAENITITGRGTIDGQGKKWWDETLKNVAEIRETGKVKSENKWQKLWVKENPGLEVSDYYKQTLERKFFRPPFIQTYRCKNVRIEGITIQNSPFWTVNPEFCDNVTVTGITIFNPESPNTDGINPESCKNVHISDCHISVGDDCITIKSGRDADGRKYNVPCENITITNCTMLNGHGGVVIGSEMSGGVKNVVISNCIFDGTDRGIRLKTMRGRGGVVENIRVSNIIMKNIPAEAIVFNMFYGKTEEGPASIETPRFRNFHLSNITGINVNQACKVDGLPEMPVSEITFSNINMDAKIGFEVSNCKQLEMHDVNIRTSGGPAVTLSNTEYSILDNIRTTEPLLDLPLLKIQNGKDIYVHSCFPLKGTGVFLLADGNQSENIVLQNNNFSGTKEKIKLGNAIDASAIVIKP